MYIRSVLCLGADKREIRHYYPARRKDAQKGARARSKEEMQRDNDRRRERYVQNLIRMNFKPGDWHLVLRYPKGKQPKTYEEAQERLGYFVTMMRTVYKAAGLPFKYIAVTERGKRGNSLHHHLIIEDIDQEGRDGIRTTRLVKQLWPGTSGWFDLYEEGEFQELAAYLVKKDSKEELEKGKSSYKASRNLIRPKAIRTPVFRRAWDKEPKAPKGWQVIRETVLNATIKETGQPYQRYTIRRIKGQQAASDAAERTQRQRVTQEGGRQHQRQQAAQKGSRQHQRQQAAQKGSRRSLLGRAVEKAGRCLGRLFDRTV